MRARVAEAVDVRHGPTRSIGQMQVLIWRHWSAPLLFYTLLQPLKAHHVPVRPYLRCNTDY